MNKGLIDRNSLDIRRTCAITATARNLVPLIGCGANATRSAAKGGRAAFGLALIVLKHEEVVGADLYFGTQKRLVRGGIAPVAQTILRAFHDIVIGSDGFIVLADTRTAHHVIGKALTRVVGQSGKHQKVGEQ